MNYHSGENPRPGDVVAGEPTFSPYGGKVSTRPLQGVVVEVVGRATLNIAVVRPVSQRSFRDEPIVEMGFVRGEASRFNLVYRPSWVEEMDAEAAAERQEIEEVRTRARATNERLESPTHLSEDEAGRLLRETLRDVAVLLTDRRGNAR